MQKLCDIQKKLNIKLKKPINIGMAPIVLLRQKMERYYVEKLLYNGITVHGKHT
jgi:hypothetical protein